MQLNKDKKIIFVWASLFMVVLVFALILLLSLNNTTQPNNTPKQQTIAIPTAIPTQPQTFHYAPNTVSKLVNLVQNKQPLSTNDSLLKQKLILGIPKRTIGTLYTTKAYQITYLTNFDIFEVDISTTNINDAKNSAIAWFTNQGFSYGGICKLPLMFSVNSTIRQELEDQNVVFNPLPEGC